MLRVGHDIGSRHILHWSHVWRHLSNPTAAQGLLFAGREIVGITDHSPLTATEGELMDKRLRHRYINDIKKQYFARGLSRNEAEALAIKTGIDVGFIHPLWHNLTDNGAKSLRIRYKC